ncbi:MAG: bifunctional DNA primase/polymerase, partial [Sporichthyaceae bacterium]
MTAPFDRAESYRALGWTGTIPLPPAAKWPPPAGFTGDAGRWPAPDDFKRWRRGGYTTKDTAAGLLHHDAHNIALRMPPAVVGLDVDMYGQKPGRATLAGLEDKLGALPATWMTSSRDDGSGIRCYRVPPGLIWPTDAGPGIEIIRHGHRYAVAAPSLHPTTGQPYRWLGPDGTETDPPRPGDLPELPPSWVAYLTGTDAEGQPSTSRPGSRARLREAHKAGRDWLDELPDGQACTYVGTLAADCRAAATREDGNAYDHTRDAVLALLRA